MVNISQDFFPLQSSVLVLADAEKQQKLVFTCQVQDVLLTIL